MSRVASSRRPPCNFKGQAVGMRTRSNVCGAVREGQQGAAIPDGRRVEKERAGGIEAAA